MINQVNEGLYEIREVDAMMKEIKTYSVVRTVYLSAEITVPSAEEALEIASRMENDEFDEEGIDDNVEDGWEADEDGIAQYQEYLEQKQ